MEREQLRLECLKLAVSRTTDLQESVARAEIFYGFVIAQPKPVEMSPITPIPGAGVTAGKDRNRPG
jgi:hypothetical protein